MNCSTSQDMDMEEGGHILGTWGQLYPHSGTFPRLALNQEIFRLGRAKTSGYVIRESDMGGSKWLNAVSKCQCEIVRNCTGIRVPTASG